MSRKLMMYALCAVGIALMAFTVSAYFRMSSIAASNQAVKLQDYADVRLITLGIGNETSGGVVEASGVVRQIRLRLMLLMGTGAVMAFVGLRSLASRPLLEQLIPPSDGLPAN